MSDNENHPCFLFPPPFQVPPVEYKSFVVDLPHLNFQSHPVESKQKNLYHLFNARPKGNFETSEILESIVNCITTFHHPRAKGAVFTNRDKERLLEDERMYDSTVNVLIKWIEVIRGDYQTGFYSICSNLQAEVIRLSHKVYKDFTQEFKDYENEITKKRLEEIKNIQRNVKQIEENLHESKCIFIINNISDIHWNLVCLCNISTLLSGNMMDMKNNNTTSDTSNIQKHENGFKDYKPPCFLVLDSMGTTTEIDDCTNALIHALRFWLTFDEEVNPSKIVFDEVNLPVFTIPCTMQEDAISCGYFVFRNIIGLLMAERSIFPLKIADLVHKATTKSHYVDYLVSNSKNHTPTKIRKIVDAKEMLYNAYSVQTTFRNEVKTLFERLQTFYDLSNKKLNYLKNLLEDQDQVKNDIENVIMTSSGLEKTVATKYFDNRVSKHKNDAKKQLHEFFLNKNSKTYTRSTKCFCPGVKEDSLIENDPHHLPNWTYQCKRTKTKDRGFNFIRESDHTVSEIGDTSFIPDFLQRVANGCQLHHTPCSPSTGDCGLHLFAFVLCTATSITKHQIECRSILNLDQLLDFDKSGTNIQSIYADSDASFYVRALFSQYIKCRKDFIPGLLEMKTFDLNMKNIFHINSLRNGAMVRTTTKNSNFLKGTNYELNEPEKWKLHKKFGGRRKLSNAEKKSPLRDFDCFLDLNESEVSACYNTIVLKYLSNFCSKIKQDFKKKFYNAIEKYVAMPPSILGTYGCFWANNESVDWFEQFFLVKIFIAFPGMNEAYTFTPHVNDAYMTSSTDYNYESNRHNKFFELKDNELAAIGLIVLVFDGSHYDCLLRPTGSKIPFFQIGKDLPELFYNAFNITPKFWMSSSLSATQKHNENVLKSLDLKAESLEENILDSKYFCPYKFAKIHKESEGIKYTFDDLTEILYGNSRSHVVKSPQTPSRTKHQKKPAIKEHISLFNLCIPEEFFVLKAPFVAGRIFRSLFSDDEHLSKVGANFEAHDFSLRGKYFLAKEFLQAFSYDLQYLSPGNNIDYMNMVYTNEESENDEEFEISDSKPKATNKSVNKTDGTLVVKINSISSIENTKSLKNESKSDSFEENQKMIRTNKESENDQLCENLDSNSKVINTIANRTDYNLVVNLNTTSPIENIRSSTTEPNRQRRVSSPVDDEDVRFLTNEPNPESIKREQKMSFPLSNLTGVTKNQNKDQIFSDKDNKALGISESMVLDNDIININLYSPESPDDTDTEDESFDLETVVDFPKISKSIRVKEKKEQRLIGLILSIPSYTVNFNSNGETIQLSNIESRKINEFDDIERQSMMSCFRHNLTNDFEIEEAYLGTNDLTVFSMDNYEEMDGMNMSDNLPQMQATFADNRHLMCSAIEFLRSSNLERDSSFFLPRYHNKYEDGKHYLLFNMTESPYFATFFEELTEKSFLTMLQELHNLRYSIFSKSKSGKNVDDCIFCNTYGILFDPGEKSEGFDFSVIDKSYYNDESEILKFPINTINQRGQSNEEESHLNIESSLYSDKANIFLYILIDIAYDVLRKSSIFLHFTQMESDLLRMIIENLLFPPSKNTYLFTTNCFHRICCITSRCSTTHGKLNNHRNSFTLLCLLTDDKDFKINLFNPDHPECKINIHQYEIILLTENHPFEYFDASNSTSNYVLVQFGLSKSLHKFFNSSFFIENHSIYENLCMNTNIQKFINFDETIQAEFYRKVLNNVEPFDNAKKSSDHYGFYRLDMQVQLEKAVKNVRYKRMMNITENPEIKKFPKKKGTQRQSIIERKRTNVSSVKDSRNETISSFGNNQKVHESLCIEGSKDSSKKKKINKSKSIDSLLTSKKSPFEQPSLNSLTEQNTSKISHSRTAKIPLELPSQKALKKARLEQRNAKKKAERLSKSRKSPRIDERNQKVRKHLENQRNNDRRAREDEEGRESGSSNLPDEEKEAEQQTVYDDILVQNSKANNRTMYGVRGGYITIPFEKCVGKKRSCVQDAVINIAMLSGLDIKDEIYKRIPPMETFDTVLEDVFRDKFVSSLFHFNLIKYNSHKGGNEYFTFNTLLPRGGKYIIKCKVLNKYSKRDEEHLFILDADYVDKKTGYRGAIIDNQLHTQLTLIEPKDLVNLHSMRRICTKLFGGKTFFNICWLVTKKKQT